MEPAPVSSPPASSTLADTVTFRSLLGVEEHKRSTDDVLAAAMPLLRQVAELHDQGLVGPLAGVEELRCLHGRVFFANARARKPEHAPLRLAQIEREETGAVE